MLSLCRLSRMSLISFLVFLVVSCSPVSAKKRCSSRWIITGYYTPIENDYNGKAKKTIRVAKTGRFTFLKSFLKAVKMEGWGKTKAGWYLGYYARKWHKSKTPLNALGYPLEIGMIATDKKLIPRGEKLTIPKLPGPFKNIVYVSSDSGQKIRGKHIDVYMGEGKQAEKATYKITGENYRICKVPKGRLNN